jgi:DNA-binding response OmpR family regulator
MMHFFRKRKLNELKQNMTRDELVRRSRILVIDDERPAIIDDLKSARFSVDHVPDVSSHNLELVDHPLYDLILLDFGQVGKTFGDDQGLSLLRHIKRVNPAIVVLTYTSKALETRHADFYRLADGTLAKDAVQESGKN